LPSTTGIEGGFLKPPHLIPSGVALRASLSPAGRGEKKRGIFPSPQRGEGKDEGASIFPFIKPTKEARGSKAELVRHRFSDSTTGIRGGLFYTGRGSPFFTKDGMRRNINGANIIWKNLILLLLVEDMQE